MNSPLKLDPADDQALGGWTTARALRSEAEALDVATQIALEIEAIAADPHNNGSIPHRQAGLLSSSGLTAIGVPRDFGGLGASVETVVETVRRISVADGGVGQILQIHNVMLRGIFNGFADEARDRLVRDVLAGKRLGNALAETGGKKRKTSVTRVERRADGKRVLNGHKIFATGSFLAEWVSVSASSDDGPVNVYVHRDTPGLELNDDWHAFGQNNSVSGSITFRDIEIDERFVPQRADGGGLPGRTGLTWPQILHAAIDTGIARGALTAATRYLREEARPWIDADVDRAAHEHHIIKTVGDYAVAVRAAESLLKDAARLFDQHKAAPEDKALQDELILAVASARAQSDYASLYVSSDMFSLLGASASYTKWNLDRFWRNARVHTTHDPIRWRLHHIGNYYLNDVDPVEYGAALRQKRELEAQQAATDARGSA